MLTACSSMVYEGAEQSIKEAQQKVDSLVDKAAQPMPKEDTRTVPVRDDVYLGASIIKRQNGQQLPVRLEKEGVRLMSAAPMSLLSIGDLIAETTGIPVSFATDIFEQPGKEKKREGDNPDQSGNRAQEISNALDAAASSGNRKLDKNGGSALFFGRPSPISQEKMRVNFRGSLSDFMHQVAAYFDVSWRYQDGRMQFSRLVTRSFQLAASPIRMDGNATMSAGIGENSGSTGGSGGGSGGGSSSSSASGGVTGGASQSAKVDIKLDLWKELQDSLKTIIGNQGDFTASPSSGMLTVTAPTSVMERVARQVQEINRQLLRQVALKVEVYSLALTKDSSWRFDLAGALAVGAGVYSFGNAVAPSLAAAGIGASVVGGGKFDGSKAVLSLLEEKGDVSVVNTASVTTMSGQPVPVQVSTTQSYLESLTSTVSDGVVTVTPNVNSVNSGFSLNLLPKVMDDGKILLQYSMNLSTLVGKDNGFNTYEFPGTNGEMTKLSLPNLDQRSFIQSGLINNGATLVLAGFERLTDKTADDGQGSANFKLLGGKRTSQQARDMLVVMITPVVLDHSAELARMN
ncbi:secretin N-terminal domain-containing protein [Chromobacterium amazonense]|nr:secretin N-terminal domain-containing protein [Chromobacterium amazonense]